MKRASALAVLLAASLALAPDAASNAPRAMPHPAPIARREGAADANARCAACHRGIAAEQARSQHAAAWSDPSFAAAFAREPLAFCRGCHAPEARAPELGVACVTCHLPDDGAVLAAPRASAARAPHAVMRDARFAGDGACAACHDFAFPRGAARMQTTVAEHRASAHAATPCAGCHMPRDPRDGHLRHEFAVTDDAIRGALVVRASRASSTEVALTVSARAVGHAVPTGDLFRRIAVVGEAIGEDWQVLAEARRYLARHFRDSPATLARELASDDRPGAGGDAHVTLDLGDVARGRRIAWRVVYERVLHPRSARDEDAVVESTVAIAQGILSP